MGLEKANDHFTNDLDRTIECKVASSQWKKTDFSQDINQ